MEKKIKLSKRNEKLLWVGSWTSKIGDKLFDYANSVFIVGLGGPASVILALYQSSETLMGVFFNLFGGIVADGYSRKKVCIITDILSGLTCFALVPLLQSEIVGLYVVVANIFLSVIHAFNSPTYKSIVRDVILKERIRVFNSIARGVTEVIRVVSPIIGLVLVKLIGVKGALIIDGCTFVLSAFVESFLKSLPDCVYKPTNQKAVWQEMKEGLKYIRKEHWILFLLILSGIVNFFLAGYNLLLPFTDTLFPNEDGFYGKAMMAEALGGIAGAFICSKIKARETIKKMIFYLATTGVWLILIPIFARIVNPNGCLLLFFLFAGSLSIYNIQFSSYVQIQVQMDYLGRVFSIIYTIAVLFMPLGSFAFSKVIAVNMINNYYIIGGGIVFAAIVGVSIDSKIISNGKQRK